MPTETFCYKQQYWLNYFCLLRRPATLWSKLLST